MSAAPLEKSPDSARTERPALLAFATDAESEAVLRDGFNIDALERAEVYRGGLDVAARVLEKSVSPRVLLVDISGNKQPLQDLAALSQLVEPDVRVLAIGDRDDLTLYRGLTQGLGVVDYLFKPLTPEIVSRHFKPVVTGELAQARLLRAGKVITVTGVHGGVGATTIASNLAWYLAERLRRHTLLLDSDLYGAAAAMILSVKGRPGLRAALEDPDRVDDLFLERSAHAVGDRLFVLSGEGKLTDPLRMSPDALPRVLDALRQRYKFLICDASVPGSPIGRDLFDAAHQRILVTDPSVAGARDALRYLSTPAGSQATGEPLLVLNMVGIPGAIDVARFSEAIGREPDVVIPYSKATLRMAADLGEPAVDKNASFGRSIQTLASRAGSVREEISKRRGFWTWR